MHGPPKVFNNNGGFYHNQIIGLGVGGSLLGTSFKLDVSPILSDPQLLCSRCFGQTKPVMGSKAEKRRSIPALEDMRLSASVRHESESTLTLAPVRGETGDDDVVNVFYQKVTALPGDQPPVVMVTCPPAERFYLLQLLWSTFRCP